MGIHERTASHAASDRQLMSPVTDKGTKRYSRGRLSSMTHRHRSPMRFGRVASGRDLYNFTSEHVLDNERPSRGPHLDPAL